MNIKKLKKLINNPKKFFADSKIFKTKNEKKIKSQSFKKLCFVVVGNDQEKINKTLLSIKNSEKKCPVSNHQITLLQINEDHNFEKTSIHDALSKFDDDDYVKIIHSGEEINEDFLSEYYNKTNFIADDDIIIHAYAADITILQLDTVVANIKHTVSKDSSHSKDYLFPHLSICIFKNQVLNNLKRNTSPFNFNLGIDSVIEGLFLSNDQNGYQFLSNAYQGNASGERIDAQLQELVKSGSPLIKTLLNIRLALEDNEIDLSKSKSLFCLIHNMIIILLRNKKADELLTQEEISTAETTLVEILTILGPDVIKGYSASNYNHIHKIGYLKLIGLDAARDIAYLEEHDSRSKSIKFKIASHTKNFPRCYIDGKEIIPNHIKMKNLSVFDLEFSYETYVWIPFSANNKKVSFENNFITEILVAGKRVKSESYGKLASIIDNKAKIKIALPRKVKLLRSISESSYFKNKFLNCWVFVDNDLRADDNAEHFYRYVKENQPNVNAYFLLNKSSSDWERLKKQGFNLIEFGSLQHRIALLNAKFLLSSHANPAIVNYLPRKHFSDIMKYKFVFLQHGVTKDDQSEWLNSRKIDYLVTAGTPEFEDIANQGRYRYTSKEVVLTGFPRYDNLQKTETKKQILIMPTWRKSLAGELMKKSSKRIKNENFSDSAFCKEWGGFLQSKELKNLVEAHDFSVLFLPHPNLIDYLEDLEIPDYINIGSLTECSIQKVFKESDLLITDYSSVAFDVAYMRKPVLYFHFDIDTFFSEHSYSKGYYDYEKHGFGSVASNIKTLQMNLSATLKNKCHLDEYYAKRINDFFPYDDNKNSERLFNVLNAPTSKTVTFNILHNFLTLQLRNNDLLAAEKTILEISNKSINLNDHQRNLLKQNLNEISFWSLIQNRQILTSKIFNHASNLNIFIPCLNVDTDYHIEHDYYSSIVSNLNELVNFKVLEKSEAIDYTDINNNHDYSIKLTPQVANFIDLSLKNNHEDAIELFNDLQNETMFKQAVFLHLLHGINLVKTGQTLKALNLLRKIKLTDDQKDSLLVLIYEKHLPEDQSSLNLNFLITTEPTSTAKEAFLYLNKTVTLAQYSKYFENGNSNDVLLARYLNDLYKTKSYTSFVDAFNQYDLEKSYLSNSSNLAKYFISIFITQGIESLNSKILEISGIEDYKSTFDSLFLNHEEISLDTVYQIIEQTIEKEIYPYTCSEIYKYSLYFYKNNRPGLAKKLTTMSVMKMHEDFYSDKNNWENDGDYRTLISAVTELNNAVHELNRIG